MAKFEKQEGQGALFKNEDRKTDKHPQYKGDILIAGTEYWLAGWIKEGKNGKFFSLKATPKTEKSNEGIRRNPGPQSEDDVIPF
jgi:hypothetical protein